MGREIVLDTETTGLNPEHAEEPDRIVEIGCVELEDKVPTGEVFHCYINPERLMPISAFQIHGLSDQFLADKPLFAQIVDPFLKFIGDAPLVIHNAAFDMRFINSELKRIQMSTIPMSRSIDSLQLARSKFPGKSANLDALCKRFKIDLSERQKHSALLDAKLLAAVYLELVGGKQAKLEFASTNQLDANHEGNIEKPLFQQNHETLAPRDFAPSKDEIKAHQNFLASIKNALWNRT
ncbi:MAG: DNA polymerase III subunit epsilon [Pseudomonadota bacterium]